MASLADEPLKHSYEFSTPSPSRISVGENAADQTKNLSAIHLFDHQTASTAIHPMTIRRYMDGEEAAIWGVYFRATHETNAADYHRDLLNRWAPPDMNMAEWVTRLREKNPFVALLEGHIVGFAELDGVGFLDYFYVSPDHQRQGIGKALMSTLVSEAAALGLRAITADVSITAKGFFAA